MRMGKVIGLIIGLLIGFVIGFILVSYWNDTDVRPAMHEMYSLTSPASNLQSTT